MDIEGNDDSSENEDILYYVDDDEMFCDVLLVRR